MRIGLHTRLFAAFLAVALVGLGSAGYLVDRSVERVAYEQTADRLRYEVTMTGQMTASAMFAPLTRDDHSLEGPLRELGIAVHTHLSLVAPDGTVVADSEAAPGGALPQDDVAPEIQAARVSGRGQAVRGDGDARRLWVAEAVMRDGALLGIARASVPVATIDAQVIAVRRRLALGAAVALLLAALSALAIAFGIVRPIRRLSRAARKLGEGELDVRANIATNDEIGDLGLALDDMASNIQRLVVRLDERNADVRRVLDTIDQGLVTVDLTGAIAGERSARVDAWFGPQEAGAKLWSLFPELTADAALSYEMAWEQIAEDCLPMECVLDQLPERITGRARTFQLRYLPIGDDAVSRKILVIITDVTSQLAAERVEAVQRDILRVIGRIKRDPAAVLDFVRDTATLFEQLERSPDGAEARRHLHTLKGNCAVFGIQSVASRCHALESSLAAEERPISAADRRELAESWTEVRQGFLSMLGGDESAVFVPREQFFDVLRGAAAGASPSVTTQRLAAWILTPVDVSFARIAEHATTLARRTEKDVAVVCSGGGLALDGVVWGAFWAALVHAVRNAIDHGLEPAEARAESGKSPSGTLALSAHLDDQRFVVEVRDDGRGIDWTSIASRLRDRGLPSTTRADLVEGLFLDGLSTRQTVSEISGRGVGMNALRAAVHAHGGVIEVGSVRGNGTTVRCVFPASAARVDANALLAREACEALAA